MPINETKLNQQIQRLITLPFPGRDPEAVKTRIGEFVRILRAGLRDSNALCVVVDDLVEHCEECPTPAAVVDAVRRFNADTVSYRRQREQDEERRSWPQKYGEPSPAITDNCLTCGLPWSAITKRSAEAMKKQARLAKQLMAAGEEQEWSAAHHRAKQELRRQGVIWHSDTCGSGASR